MGVHPPRPLLQFIPFKLAKYYKFSLKTLQQSCIFGILVLSKIKYPRPPASEIQYYA